MYSRQVVAVRSDSSIKTFSDLAGKVVAVMSSTKPESIFLENKDGRLPSVKNVYSMENMNLVFSALQLGYADAAAGHETVVRQYIDTTPGEYRLLDESLLSASIGIAFGKDRNNDISNELSRVLTEMENDGTLGNILEEYGVSAKSADGGEIQ
jgi:polar amino acid transport system substrate-binding protein